MTDFTVLPWHVWLCFGVALGIMLGIFILLIVAVVFQRLEQYGWRLRYLRAKDGNNTIVTNGIEKWVQDNIDNLRTIYGQNQNPIVKATLKSWVKFETILFFDRRLK